MDFFERGKIGLEEMYANRAILDGIRKQFRRSDDFCISHETIDHFLDDFPVKHESFALIVGKTLVDSDGQFRKLADDQHDIAIEVRHNVDPSDECGGGLAREVLTWMHRVGQRI
ncbi:hypothetical protein [Paramagnetospirillum caucaseum]|uniref:hypothetical protein n=1 Tax=Paramagnetospirillum caucaseum TaxID=1244869 RepID=UPI001268820C|nr:hypothetical protein [Paramagnetospirillum caucaseum]